MPRSEGLPAPAALRHPGMVAFFGRVMDRQMTRRFHAVRLARPGLPALPEGRPLMVVTNHPAWWDPALIAVLAPRLFPGREGYGPIEAAMLERYRFMARIGLFGIAPGPGGAARFLRDSQALLAAPHRMLWITAQGRFADPRERPLGLRPGAARLMARVPGLVALPLAVEYPFWSESRPEALACFGAPVEAGAGEGAAQLHARLEAGLERAMDRLAGLAVARDPEPFETLLQGRRGIGGIYDLSRRLRAALAGRRFDPAHLPEREEAGR